MQVFIDYQLIQLSKEQGSHQTLLELSQACIRGNILNEGESLEIGMGWPLFLATIDQSSIFENFPQFNDQHPFFSTLQQSIRVIDDKNVLTRLFDQLFVECLTHVKALPQIDQTFLLEAIKKQQEGPEFLKWYQKILIEHPYEVLHDLTLYLAWDRVCVALATLFEDDYANTALRKRLEVFRSCLLESFQHITFQGKTRPSLYRLIEALYAFDMREDNFQKYSDSEWNLLSQSISVIGLREKLPDQLFIDFSLIDQEKMKGLIESESVITPIRVLTLEQSEKVRIVQALSQYMVDKLHQQNSEWRYVFYPVEVICLKRTGKGFVVEGVVTTP